MAKLITLSTIRDFIAVVRHRRFHRAGVPDIRRCSRAVHAAPVLEYCPASNEADTDEQALYQTRLRVWAARKGLHGEQHVPAACCGDQRERPQARAARLPFALPRYRQREDIRN